MNLRLFKICFFLAIMFGCSAPALAQLPRDVRDVFEVMLDELDEDLQKKFKAAIKKDTATVEFTGDEFKRFRDNPANPFEGLDRIVVDENGGSIALKFELPSIRNRVRHPMERQSDRVLSQIGVNLGSAAASTVRVYSGTRHVAMGTVVRSNGLVLTKASEIAKRDEIAVVLADGQRLDAKLIRKDATNDLALLKIEASGLAAIEWSSRQMLPGEFVITPAHDGTALALGTFSVVARSTVSGEQAFLGVQPETTPLGVRVSDIRPGNASFDAGLKDGDVITKLGGFPITDVSSLVKSIRDHRSGDQVEIEYLRAGSPAKTTATLSGKHVSGEQAARFKMMNRLGAIPSRRADNFPTVFQHDSPLFPEDCGSPITDVDGNVIGINIARQGRAASYAIPARHVQTVLKDLLRESVASATRD